MSDYKSLPSWRRGMSFAHAVYAAVESAGLKETDAGRQLRKAAVSIPSLIAEASLDLTGRDRDEVLFTADSKLAEVGRLLEGVCRSVLPEADRVSLLAEVHLLAGELAGLREAKVT